MAQLDRSFVRLRFTFGKGEVKGRQRYARTAAYTVGKVAVAFAEDMWKDAQGKIKDQIDKDVRRELVHTAYMYRRFITEAGGNRSGTLTSAVSGAPPLALSGALPPWAPRGAEYLERKAAGGAGKKWFNNKGWRARRSPGGKFYPVDPGRLTQEIDYNFFEKSFGPISVKVERNNRVLPKDAEGYIELGKNRHPHIQVARITVSALNRITPDILSTLRTGSFAGVSNPAIPAMIYGSGVPFAKQIGNRLGPSSRGRFRPGQHGSYRATLEPFIGYFLTRSIPAAVSRRVKQGNLGRVTRG